MTEEAKKQFTDVCILTSAGRKYISLESLIIYLYDMVEISPEKEVKEAFKVMIENVRKMKR